LLSRTALAAATKSSSKCSYPTSFSNVVFKFAFDTTAAQQMIRPLARMPATRPSSTKILSTQTLWRISTALALSSAFISRISLSVPP
jgi:hypothetical protein